MLRRRIFNLKTAISSPLLSEAATRLHKGEERRAKPTPWQEEHYSRLLYPARVIWHGLHWLLSALLCF